MLELTVATAAFALGTSIPLKYTCCGDDVSPAVSWSAVPKETQSIALICDDPDAPAGTWVHWVIFNIPPQTTEIKENTAKQAQLPDGSVQGINDFGRAGYGGPCPPPGKAHRYYFRVYALDTKLQLGEKTTRADLLRAMKGHILAQGETMGQFKR